MEATPDPTDLATDDAGTVRQPSTALAWSGSPAHGAGGKGSGRASSVSGAGAGPVSRAAVDTPGRALGPAGGPVNGPGGPTHGHGGPAGGPAHGPAGPSGGLRERKKAATRQALHEAALRLVTEHGIDNVTVEAIADAATVSRRTFSNYFSSKEEALFHADRVFIERLVALVHARPAGEPPWTALTRAADEFLPMALDVDRIASRRLIRNHPSLISHQVAVYATIERALAAELAQRMPDGGDSVLRSRILAATFLTTVRVTTQHWLDHPESPLPQLIHEALGFTADRS